jgi:hypothetical protein
MLFLLRPASCSEPPGAAKPFPKKGPAIPGWRAKYRREPVGLASHK